MLAPGRQAGIDLGQRHEIPGAEIILRRAAITAQAAKATPLDPADTAGGKLGAKARQQPRRIGDGIGVDYPLAALVHIVVEPHILAMVLDIELLLGLAEAAGEEPYSVALVIVPQ
ncbi:hypothetical protein D3C85_1585040 [compost metagenome]